MFGHSACWVAAAPPPVPATLLPPATAIVATQEVAEEASLPAPPDPPSAMEMIRTLREENASLKSRIEALEGGYVSMQGWVMPLLQSLLQRVEVLESARSSSSGDERRGCRALEGADGPGGDR